MQFEELFDICGRYGVTVVGTQLLVREKGVTQITVGRGHGFLGRKWCVVVTNSAVTTEF